MRLYLQRRYRLDRFDELYTPDVIKREAARLLAEAEDGMGEDERSEAWMVYPDYVDRRRREGA